MATLASIVGGGLYLAQNYTVSGLHQLKVEPLAAQTSTSAPGGWTEADRASLLRPSVQDSGQTALPGFPSTSHALQGYNRGLAPSLANPMFAPPNTTASAPPTILPSGALPISANSTLAQSPASATIRIATFNLHLFGRHKVDNPFVVETIAKILRQFDVIAIQEICTKQRDLLPILVDRVNQSDRRFDYMIGPRVGRTDNKEQFAFIFDTTRLETDRQQLYSVDDPEDLLNREPLVGWFRCKAIQPELAFTFTLVNVHLDSELSDQEIQVLPELVRSIHRDGRKEDDVILVGDFGASDRRLHFLRSASMIFALEGVPTTAHGTAMLDNIVMPAKATDEFNGRSGIYDFLRQFNLSIEQAHQVSDHLPVWAEFYANEGGQPGRVQ
ncbi:MAG: endonuclease/exonuclease/phosphatase family protein [Pirellulaceae bacterium]|nr:endonuclease/exonuclease/phosphatase family protein [Pirellulaceae bacterium]